MLIVLQAPCYAQNSASILWRGLDVDHARVYHVKSMTIHEHVDLQCLFKSRKTCLVYL